LVDFGYNRATTNLQSTEEGATSLRPDYRVAALTGGLATENDAQRLARSQAPVKQIATGTLCHLEVRHGIERARGLGTAASGFPFSLRTSAIWFARLPGLPVFLVCPSSWFARLPGLPVFL